MDEVNMKLPLCDGMHFVNIYDVPGSPDNILLYWYNWRFSFVRKDMIFFFLFKMKILSSFSHPITCCSKLLWLH